MRFATAIKRPHTDDVPSALTDPWENSNTENPGVMVFRPAMDDLEEVRWAVADLLDDHYVFEWQP